MNLKKFPVGHFHEFVVVHLDDDPLELKSLARKIKNNSLGLSFKIYSFSSLPDFKQQISKLKKIDFAILDIYLSDNRAQTGLSVVNELKKNFQNIIILMSSNLDDPDSVLLSLRMGADEFISKKNDVYNIVEKMLLVRNFIFKKRGLIIDDKDNKEFYCPYPGETIQKVSHRIPYIVDSAISSVYVEGDSGTGKEVIVELFQNYVKDIPFVKLNCGSIAPSLLESELFGYVKGAFTGALAHKFGLLESASGGWLFLDEVASLSENAQVAMLRVLENQEITRIGESFSRKINVRFIAASNIPLLKRVEEGKFRNDLWQRLRETEIILKPLRHRKNEIPEIINYFCKTMRGGPYTIDKTAMNVLCQISWSEGNVRELRNCLRAMTEHQTDKILSPMGIPERILLNDKMGEKEFTKEIDQNDFIKLSIKNSLGEFVDFKKLSDQLLIEYLKIINPKNINISKSAQILGVARSTLQEKLKILMIS